MSDWRDSNSSHSPAPPLARPAGPPPNYPPPDQPPLARPVDVAYAAAGARAACGSVWSAWSQELRALTVRGAGLDLLLVFLLAIGLHYVPQLVMAGFVDLGSIPIPPVNLLILEKWSEAGVALVLLGYLVLRHQTPARLFGLTAARPWRQLAWGVGGLFACYAAMLSTSVIALAAYVIFPELQEDLQRRMEFARSLPTDNLLVIVLLLLGVVIHEEVIFRGLLLPFLWRVTGAWWKALLASSVVFGMLHVPGQGILAGLQIAFVGAALGFVFLASRSIAAAALAHFLFNFIQLQLLPIVERYSGALKGGE